MPKKPWSVGLASTGYDMKDLRAALATALSDEMGFGVLAYERSGFPVEPQVHSHEACVQAFHQADIMVVIIDRRYGGLYLGYSSMSVTVQEYRKAVERGKIIIPCVRFEAWQDRYNCFNTLRQLEKNGIANPRSEIFPSYVDSWQVLDFIDEVRKAEVDNFVITFNNSDDLISELQGRLKGLSRHWVSKIVETQCGIVKDIKTTTGMAFSLGDVLKKGYFLEPPYIVKSGEINNSENITSVVSNLKEKDECIAILGQPGSGKSTVIGKAFLEHANQSLEEKSNRLPFYVSLRGRGANFSFSFEEYIDNAFETHFDKQKYPQLELSHIEPIFYMDGFDELSEDLGKLDLRRLYDSYMFKCPFILGCRSRFAAEHLNDITLGNRLSIVVELQPWDKETTKHYINEFCRLQGKNQLSAEIKTLFEEQPGMDEISTNPLLLTLFLWVVQESEMSVPLGVQSKRTLFDKCLEIWAKRELARFGKNGSPDGKFTMETLIQGWELGAWEIYTSRFSNGKTLNMKTLLRKIENTRPELSQICKKEMFSALFEIRPYTDQVTGMLHEQLLEHLSARVIVRGIEENKYPFPQTLSYVIRYEINRIVRSIWEESDEQGLQNSLENLWFVYTDTLGKNSATDLMKRNQATYYIGRLGLSDSVTRLRQANNTEDNLFVRLSIGFGLIKLCQFDIEEAFYTKLTKEEKWDIGNRGYHLVYYRDWQPEGAPPYNDPGNISWSNTMRALLRHINSNAPRHIAMRRVEIFTIKRFVETRGDPGPLDEKRLNAIEHALEELEIDQKEHVPKDFSLKVQSEYSDLKTVWEKHYYK